MIAINSIAYPSDKLITFAGCDYSSLACSVETQSEIDKQVVELVKKQHDKAINILMENREKLVELSEHLYVHETITGEEFMDILNR